MKYYFSLSLMILMLISCGEKKIDDKTYEQHRESLAEKEKKDPIHFLTVTGDHKKNLVGQTVIRGTIHNKATVTAYKDVRIRTLSYIENKMLEEHEDVIDDVLQPNSGKEFKIRYRLPKGTDSIALSVMSAVVTDGTAKKK